MLNACDLKLVFLVAQQRFLLLLQFHKYREEGLKTMQWKLTTTEVKKVFQKKLLSHKMIQF